MAGAQHSGPPTLIVRSAAAVARLTAEGVVWEEHTTVTRIPYPAVVDAMAEAVDGRRARLRIEVADREHDRPAGYELVCRTRAARTFVRALLTHRAALPATGAVPPVTTERHAPAPPSRHTLGKLGLRLLSAAFALNFLAIAATGRFLAALASCGGFFAWWACADLARRTVSLARAAWACLTRGVQVEAHYITSDLRPGTSGRMLHTWVYEYTDLDGRAYEYLTGPSSAGAEPPQTRTVTVVPDSEYGAQSRTQAVATLLVLLPVLLLVLVALAVAGLVAMPGVLLLGLGGSG